MIAESQLKELCAKCDLWQARANAMSEIVSAVIAVWESHQAFPIYDGRSPTFANRADVSEPALKQLGAAIKRYKQLASEEKAA